MVHAVPGGNGLKSITIMTKDLNFDLHSRTTNRMMGHASQMAREGYEKTCTEIYSKHAAAA